MTCNYKVEEKYIICEESNFFLVNALIIQALPLLQMFKLSPFEFSPNIGLNTN